MDCLHDIFISDTLEQIDFSTADRSSLTKRGYQTTLTRRVMGKIEAVSRNRGDPIYAFDLNIEFLNTKALFDKLQPGESPLKTNFVNDYYVARPASLEKFSLFNIFSNFKYVPNRL